MAGPSRSEAKQATREALMLAALELFSEQGLEGPSLDKICARAGYTRGAFYVHFSSRDALALAVVERVWTGWRTMADGAAPPDGVGVEGVLQTFSITFLRVFADPEADPFLRLGLSNIGFMFMAARRRPEFAQTIARHLRPEVERLERILTEAQRQGLARDDIDPGATAELLLTLVFGMLALLPAGVPSSLPGIRQVVTRMIAPVEG